MILILKHTSVLKRKICQITVLLPPPPLLLSSYAFYECVPACECVCQCVEYGICLVFGRKMLAAMDMLYGCAFIQASKIIYFPFHSKHGRAAGVYSHNDNIGISPLACWLTGCCCCCV